MVDILNEMKTVSKRMKKSLSKCKVKVDETSKEALAKEINLFLVRCYAKGYRRAPGVADTCKELEREIKKDKDSEEARKLVRRLQGQIQYAFRYRLASGIKERIGNSIGKAMKDVEMDIPKIKSLKDIPKLIMTLKKRRKELDEDEWPDFITGKVEK